MVKTHELTFPTGVRTLLPRAAAVRRGREQAILSRLEGAGYQEVIVPVIDFLAPYAELADERTIKESYRFVDRSGELVWLRSDFTPLLARVLAPHLAELEVPLRVCYRGDVVRWQESRLGQSGAFFQIGAEKIGGADLADDVEILTLLADVLDDLGVETAVTCSDARLVPLLVDSASAIPETRTRIFAAIENKQLRELERLRSFVSDSTFGLLELLVRGSFDLSPFIELAATREAAGQLDALQRALPPCRSTTFLFSLDEVAPRDSYYTALRFRIESPAGKKPLGRGGRYDRLYSRFGASTPSVGFTLDIDSLEELT